jgi:hypothetical protein
MDAVLLCSLKVLPLERAVAAAAQAREINPANHAPVERMMLAHPGVIFPREHLAVVTTKYWGPQPRRLTVGFLDNPPADLRARLLSHMNAWSRSANVQFVATNTDPQVRIARQGGRDGGYWSYLGTDILSIDSGQPTMNLEAFTMNTVESEFHRVVRHETGHTLGFPHEHMRAELVAKIDPAKAIKYFWDNDGWDESMVRSQVLTPISESSLMGTPHADALSIMCYQLPGEITTDGQPIIGGLDIDPIDYAFAASKYPKITAAVLWNNGKAYFFVAGNYYRYDVAADRVDAGYPLPTAGNWPGMGSDLVDAAVMWNNGKAYFFSGNQYRRYDVAADRVDGGYPLPIAGNWPGLWADGVDAAVVWNNGKAYFFKDDQYVRYDIAADKVDDGYPLPIAGNWPGLWADRIDAAVMWNNGKAYFFKGSEYMRYDVAADRVDAGYPLPIANNWPGLQ